MPHGRMQSLEMRSRPSDDTSFHITGTTAGTTLICTNKELGAYRCGCRKGKYLLQEMHIQHFWSEQCERNRLLFTHQPEKN